jgi:hypothetical protein
MKTFNYHVLRILPSNYLGLKDRELQLAVRKHSSIELPEVVLLEHLDLVVSSIEGSIDRKVFVMYFGEDQIKVDGTFWNLASSGFPVVLNNRIEPPYSLIEEIQVRQSLPFYVKRIGFYSHENQLSFTANARAMEAADFTIGW